MTGYCRQHVLTSSRHRNPVLKEKKDSIRTKHRSPLNTGIKKITGEDMISLAFEEGHKGVDRRRKVKEMSEAGEQGMLGGS